MAGKRKPWDRRDDGRDEGWASFVIYRDLGLGRRCHMVTVETGDSLRQVHEYSGKYNWVARARAWDRVKDQARTRGELSAIENMHRRHTRLANDLQTLTAMELERHIRRTEARLRNTEDDDDEIEPMRNIASTAETAVKMERTARGEVTERTETKVDLSGLTIEQLQQLKAIRATLAQPTEGDDDDDTEGNG